MPRISQTRRPDASNKVEETQRSKQDNVRRNRAICRRLIRVSHQRRPSQQADIPLLGDMMTELVLNLNNT